MTFDRRILTALAVSALLLFSTAAFLHWRHDVHLKVVHPGTAQNA